MHNREFSIISTGVGIELIDCNLYPRQDAYTNQICVAIIEKKDFVLQEGIFHFCSMRKSKEEDTYLLNKSWKREVPNIKGDTMFAWLKIFPALILVMPCWKNAAN